jgi:mRNA-degrading endonuclease toxin of MazEF toxin-antitoxin module
MLEYFLKLLEWCKVQITLRDAKRTSRLFNEREVWWCSIGLNVGDEEFGKGPRFIRPVLVFKKFTKSSFFAIPITGTVRSGSWYVSMDLPRQQSSLMLNQGRVLNSMRLINKMTTLSNQQFNAVKKKFIELYCPEINHPAPF